MNGKMSRLLEEHEVRDLLDLIGAPAARDLPPGRLEERKQMLLLAIAAPEAVAGADHPLRSRLRRIAGWLAALVAVVVVGFGASRAEFQAVPGGHVAEAVAVAGAGAAIAVHAAAARGGGPHLDRKTSSASTRPAVIVS
jgi:hypothetical protein